MSISLFPWLKKNITLLFNASSLFGTTLVTNGLGFVYWVVAARQFSNDAIGLATAANSVMSLVGNICILGLGTLLITEIPRKPDQAGRLISTSLLAVGLTGILAGIACAFILPLLPMKESADLQPLRETFGTVLLFAVGIGLTSVSIVLDQALVGLLRGGLQLGRNSFFAVAKLVTLILVGFLIPQKTGMMIYASWALSNVLSFLILLPALKSSKKRSIKSYLPQWNLVGKLGLTGLQHHMLNMTLLAPMQLLPVIVTAMLGTKMGSWFYISWMIATFVFTLPYVLTTVLHATSSAKPQAMGQKMRVTMGTATVLTLGANVVLQIFPQLILTIFGHDYASNASMCLRILSLAAFPLIIKNHYISICRIQDRLNRAIVRMVPGGLLELALGVLGAHFGGLMGISLGWVGALCIQAAVMSPTVFRVLRTAEVPQAETGDILREEDFAAEDMEAESIWLIDTALMPVIGSSYSGIETSWRIQTGKVQAFKLATGGAATLQRPRVVVPPPAQAAYDPMRESGVRLGESGIRPPLKRTQLERPLPTANDTYRHRAILVPPALTLPSRPAAERSSQADLSIVNTSHSTISEQSIQEEVEL